MIRLHDVTWIYPHADTPSLKSVDLHIAPGEFVILCGASGSGKSTALRLMNGLIPHFHDEGILTGTVTVNGTTTTTAELDELGLATGTVLQHPRRQFFTDNAAEELAFAMENLGFDRDRIRGRVAAELTALAVGVPVEQRLSRLSGGQQQQIAIAAATTHDPGVLLLDEPSSNLSTDAIDRLVRTLAGLKARGVTIVVAEHRLRYLQDLVDRVVVMRDGTVDLQWNSATFRGVPDDVLAREGLRGQIQAVEVPGLSATGNSIVESAPATQSGSGDLELSGIHCRLGGRTILDLERVAFPCGEVTAIRGANGVGKSTLARIITGLQRCRGTVRLDGKTLTPRARQRASAIVMQDVQRQLFTDSVEAEIKLAGTNAPAVLDELDLAHLAERHPLSLSGGQQQRLVVAAVRGAHRRIVIFDEPSSGVDRRHLQSISDQIRQVASDGAVVLLISHDDDLLALAADRQLTLTPPHTERQPFRHKTGHDRTKEAK